jgi:hypothetical protein
MKYYSTAYCMILIAKRDWLTRYKNPSRASPSVLPTRHRLIKAADPPRCEILCHIFVELINQLSNGMEGITVCRRLLICILDGM